MGGFDCYASQNGDCPTEFAKYDYAKISKQGGIKEVEVVKKAAPVAKKKEIPIVKKEKQEAEGGC